MQLTSELVEVGQSREALMEVRHRGAPGLLAGRQSSARCIGSSFRSSCVRAVAAGLLMLTLIHLHGDHAQAVAQQPVASFLWASQKLFDYK